MVPTVMVPFAGCEVITMEFGLIDAEPATSFDARLTVDEPLLDTVMLSAVAVGGVGAAVTVTWTLTGLDVKPLISLIV